MTLIVHSYNIPDFFIIVEWFKWKWEEEHEGISKGIEKINYLIKVVWDNAVYMHISAS